MAEAIDLWGDPELCERRKKLSFLMQQLHLPFKVSDAERSPPDPPFATLLIYDSKLNNLLSRPEARTWFRQGLDEELLEDFKHMLPNNTILLKVDEYLTTDDAEFQDTREQRNPGPTDKCHIMGLFLPKVEQRVGVHVAWLPPTLNPDFDFATELGVNDCEYPKCTIILLTNYMITCNYTCFPGRLDPSVRRNGKEITWASLFSLRLAAGNADNQGREVRVKSTVAVTISGPGVESWSTFINYRSQSDVIEQKLQTLKAQVPKTEKRNYIGLFYAPKCIGPGCSHTGHPCGDSREMMRRLKRVFPHIRFVGTFRNFHSDIFTHAEVRNPYNLDEHTVINPQEEDLGYIMTSYFASIIILSFD